MAHIYKRKGAKKYRIQYRDETRKLRDVAGFSNLKATEIEAARLEDEVIRMKRGTLDPREKSFTRAESVPLETHLTEWRTNVVASGSSKKYAEQMLNRVRAVFALGNGGRGYTKISELDPVEVQNTVKAMVDVAGGIGQQTASHIISHCKQFSKWLFDNDRSPLHRLAKLKKFTVTDVRRARVSIAWPQIVTMIQSVELSKGHTAGPKGGRFKIAGPDRAMVYRVAVVTGLRARALRSLTPESFNLQAGAASVTVLPGYIKNKKPVTFPLPDSLADLLRPYLASKAAQKTLWPLPDDAADMLRADFRRAGIVFPDDRYTRDFHCLRHTAITGWIEAGTDLKTVQELAGHSSITLTQRYAHTTPAHKRNAVNALPPIPPKPEPPPT
jgi:integrase